MGIWHLVFGPSDFMPHGYCYLWNSGLVWLHVISDSIIALSYFAIPLLLVHFIRKRRDVPFGWMFVLFGIFIVACGATHAMEVWNLWHANYWLSGAIKAVTALASISTATLLARLLPQAVHLPSVNRWKEANVQLEKENQYRRDLELELRARETNYREQAELLDLSHDAILVLSSEGVIVYWNRGAERLYGWQKEEAVRRLSRELLQTEFPIPLREIEAQIFDRGYWEGELSQRRKDGSVVSVSSRWGLRADPSGTMSFLEINRDISARKKEERKFRNLLESAPDGMVIVTRAGTIQLVNAQTEKLFGYPREELIGQPVEILMPEKFQSKHVFHRDRYAESPRTREMGAGLQLSGRRKDGTEFPVEISLSPIDTEDGLLISSAIRDVTDRRSADDQIRKLNSELNRRIAELGHINRELETFSYSVSHDLRAPLRHIDGFARILKEDHHNALSPAAEQHVDRILQSANHMGHLVDDLLNLARVGRKELVRQKVSLDELVSEVVTSLRPETGERNIDWQIERLPDADCDPNLVRVVFSNLLSNALKFTRKQPRALIQVGTSKSDGKVTFFVRDNGVGFDPKYADKLFGVFQRLHTQEEFEGTGVGLATVQRILYRHEGGIWAESQPGHGSTFFFTLDGASGTQIQPDAEVRNGVA